jgi:hypothetical protein
LFDQLVAFLYVSSNADGTNILHPEGIVPQVKSFISNLYVGELIIRYCNAEHPVNILGDRIIFF